MKPSESDLLFGFCNVYHDYKLYPEQFVSILEYTHPKSAVPRAKVIYNGPEFSKEFYTPRVKITRPIVVKSNIFLWHEGFYIQCKATFYKHPVNLWCDETTPYIIETINASGYNFDSITQLSEFIRIPVQELNTIIFKNLLMYADDLPF
jgi:hypothetical protein